MSMVRKGREMNFELLRAVSTFLIIIHHFVVYMYRSCGSLGLFQLNNFVLSLFWAGGKFCVVLYAMITGYFMINSHIRLKKVLKLELQVLFYSISLALLFVIFDGVTVTSNEWKSFLFPTYTKIYWFISSYFFLYLSIPWLNKILLKIKREWYLAILGIMFAVLIMVPSIVIYFDGFPEWMYLFFYYMIGGYIGLYLKNLGGKKRFLFGFAVVYSSIVLSSIFIQYLSSFNKYLVGYMYSFTRINSILIFISAICLFLFFKNLKVGESRFVSWLGSVSFGIYLFHEHPYVRNFLWNHLFNMNLLLNNPYFFLFGVFISIVVFMIGEIYDWIRQVIFKYFSCIFKKIRFSFGK